MNSDILTKFNSFVFRTRNYFFVGIRKVRLSFTQINIIITLVAFSILSLFVRVDFDGGHEGYLITSAIAEKTGYVAFRDFFSLYGPVLPFIHSLAIINVDYAAICLRIFDTLLITGSIFLILNLIRFQTFVPNIRYRYLLFSALTWFSLTYFFFGQIQHPWSSTLATFMQFLIITLLLSLFQGGSRKSTEILKLNSVSMILAILPYTRLNVGIATLLSTIFLLCLIAFKSDRQRRKIFNIIGITAIYSASVIIYFVYQGTWSLLYEQSIVTPAKVMTSQWMVGSQNWNAIPTLLNYFFKSIPVIFLTLLYLKVHASNPLSPFFRRKLRARSRIGFSIAIVVALYIFISRNSSDWLYQRIIVFLAVFGVLLALCQIFYEIVVKKFERIESYFFPVLVSFFGLAGITQIYPTHDPRHIWWGMPFLILCIPLVLDQPKNGEYKIFKFERFIVLISLIMAPLLVFSLNMTLNVPRETLGYASPFKGMQVSQSKLLQLESEYRFLRKHISGTEKAYFQCGYGETYWEPSFDGTYHSKSLWFIDFSMFPGAPVPEYNFKPGDLMIICGSPQYQINIANKYGLTIFDSESVIGIGRY
jgi:hypothetical protein